MSTKENIEWNKEEFHIASPAPLIDVLDHTPQQGAMRASTADLRDVGKRGLLWLLDEESLFPGASEKTFLDKVFTNYSGKDYQQLIRKGPYNHQFTIQHFHGTNPVVYSVSGWLRNSREHPASRQVIFLLQESQKECINQLFSSSRGVFGGGGNTLHIDGGSTLRRSSSMRRAQGVSAAGMKRRSFPLQVKYTMDILVDLLKRTNAQFVQCFLPKHNACVSDGHLTPISSKSPGTDEILNIPLLRSQIRGFQVLDTVRVYKQGFPDNLMYSEFRRRFEILAPIEHRVASPVYDERQAVEHLLEHVDIDKATYRLGLSQIFFRSGTLAMLESRRDQKLNGVIASFQSHCRGYLARSAINKRKVQDMAIRCIQRNVRKFLAIKSWPWWRLYVKVLPLLDVHRTEEDLKLKTQELELLKGKLEKIEKERNELKLANDKLEAKASTGRCKCLHISTLKRFSLDCLQNISVMPGSAASPSEPPKAKVTSATNGVFVRPVAVAGIFLPPNESNNTPPVLPEKKRFSALTGDLKPSSSNDKSESNDFARRRQSWDVPQKEIVFGQALLRKTPRNTNTSTSRNVRSDSIENGSAPEIPSSFDKSSLKTSFGKIPEPVKSSERTLKSTEPKSCVTDVNINSESCQTVVNSSVKPNGDISGSGYKKNNFCSVNLNNKESLSSKAEINNEPALPLKLSVESKTSTSDQDKKSFIDRKLENKNTASSINQIQTTSTETIKQTKKVYGLIKRESKTEVSAVPSECNLDITNTSDAKNVINKPKVYGLNKQNVKKDFEIAKPEKDLSDKQVTSENSVKQSSVPEKAIERTCESKVVSECDKSGNESRVSKSPPKEFRTVRRTSDVIAARIQTIFSNFQSEKPAAAPKKSKIPDKSNISSSKPSTDQEIKDTTTIRNEKTDIQIIPDVKRSNAEETSIAVLTNEKSITSTSKSSSDVHSSFKDLKSTVLTSTTKFNSDTEVKNVPLLKSEKSNISISKVSSGIQSSTKELKSAQNLTSTTKFNSDSEVKNVSLLKNEKSNTSISKVSSGIQSSTKELKSTVLTTSEKSNLGNEVASLHGVNEEPLLKKEDSKKESSINVASKQIDKKVPNAEGKMPIKKDDKSSSNGTMVFTITTNQETDRKSSGLTASSNHVMQGVNKDTGVKKFSNSFIKQPYGAIEEKNSKIITPSPTVNNSYVKEIVQSSNKKITKKLNVSEINIENSISNKESVISKTSVSQSVVTSSTQKFNTSSESNFNTLQKSNETTKTFINSNAETAEISKIEVTKITPSTVPGIVPTVNVVFRTKSPLESSGKDENRKKVVIETCANNAPISSAVIISPKPINASSVSNAVQSVDNILKTVESLQQSVNSSPKLPEKQTKEHQQNRESIAPPVSQKIEVKIPITVEQNKISVTEAPAIAENSKMVESSLPSSKIAEKTSVNTNKAEVKLTENLSPTSATKKDFTDQYKILNMDTSVDVQSKVSVVDLSDWNKKFQRVDSEIPKAPLRRRAFRDSLPPLLPSRSPSRFGSLKRIDDSSRYLPRSPSQSSLPQRYSYTEMLSKVCSMGVLPLVEPMMSKSCSSSSSQVSELWSELSEEQSTATHASEMLEAETTERMRLEKEVHELQNRFSHAQQRSDKMEMEIMESRVYRTPELNGDLSEDEDAEGSGAIYKQKYERAVRDMELMKRRIQQQQEEEMEQKALMKKASDKRLAEALEDVDEERQIANQWKRKAQKCGAELQDLRLMLEEQMARNGELEKKQRRFDAELSAAQEEIKKERILREKFMREKEQAVNEKYSLEQDLQSAKLDADMLHEKIAQLTRELDELALSSKGEEEVTQLKRAKQDLERKSRDQEEELEELAAQVQMLEQAKLRLEMSLEKVRQEHRREASVREEEIEEIRASFSKKIKNLEAQLESEQDERHQLVKQKHELERRLYEIADQPPPHDPEIERRLRRDLKRTKALLRDAQSMLEHTREGQSSKTLIRQLKNQLEDSEFAKATAIKARQAVETELQDCQLQLEEITRTKNEAETRCLQLSREKSAIQTQLEEAEEEMAEVMKKYKAVVAQMSTDQKLLAEQNQQIADLETERQMLKEQLNEVSHKFEHLAGQSDDTHKVHWLDSKIRDLESKLELEQTTKSRLENQIARLKEQNDRMREECDSLRNKEIQAQEGVRRLQRQIRDLREDYSSLQQKEADGYRKQHELEMALENMETDLQVTKNDLRLACQRIQDLQNALEDDLDSGTDVPDDSGSDTDSSFELSVLRNQSLTPIQRCESIASNLSYDTEGRHSRTASFTQELSAFSRMMLKRTSMDFLG
ncbi:unconventional myosin-XVIIIa [Nephila pilipes]|uniref:Unconventional myosin-XVIIIa n=1 Tax=Nephila pilipes TaxID=299642 RepID=A0A8X6NEI0_NEPPI|nr:unconventional myosin-XVIIIa [Nephila pilipes]